MYRQAQVREYPENQCRLFHRGNNIELAPTLQAVFEVDIEQPVHRRGDEGTDDDVGGRRPRAIRWAAPALAKNLPEQMQVEITRIHIRIGVTTVYVMNDQTKAMMMSDRVAVFTNVGIKQFAPPLEVYARPLTRFVGEFVGDSNFFEAAVAGAGDRIIAPGLGTLRVLAAPAADAAARPDVLLRLEAIRLVHPG